MWKTSSPAAYCTTRHGFAAVTMTARGCPPAAIGTPVGWAEARASTTAVEMVRAVRTIRLLPRPPSAQPHHLARVPRAARRQHELERAGAFDHWRARGAAGLDG